MGGNRGPNPLHPSPTIFVNFSPPPPISPPSPLPRFLPISPYSPRFRPHFPPSPLISPPFHPHPPWVHIKAFGSSLGAVGAHQGPWILPWDRGYTSRPLDPPLGPWVHIKAFGSSLGAVGTHRCFAHQELPTSPRLTDPAGGSAMPGGSGTQWAAPEAFWSYQCAQGIGHPEGPVNKQQPDGTPHRGAAAECRSGPQRPQREKGGKVGVRVGGGRALMWHI